MFTKGTVGKEVKVVCSFLRFTVEWRDKNNDRKNRAEVVNLGMKELCFLMLLLLFVCLFVFVNIKVGRGKHHEQLFF